MSVSSFFFIHPPSLFCLFLSLMPLLHYLCISCFPLSDTKSLPLNPGLSPHLHTGGLDLLIKDTEERVVMSLQSQIWHWLLYFYKLSSGFWLFKEYETLTDWPFQPVLLWKRERACSCLPLFFLCLLSPTELFWLVHNRSDALSYATSSQSDFFQFLRRNPGSKEKAEQMN